ncbi:hypothetical protein [Alkalihalobacillus sp. AL-G]|uniref:hypothetical protein n=1 Tax=Alkalihalobacillus sp. AL-G TaxID=2926399 RepID=UPI00272B60B3|nr:hypothetical protein [Alkalihalobacillus sp. AL-G]WLD91856.1 hypothetical protein MOJ78_12485 [Alkalihalobacillus sp. AL-G]
MVKQWILLVIGYWSMFEVTGDLPSNTTQSMQWLSEIIIDPFDFIVAAFLFLIGISSYGMVLSDLIKRRTSSAVHTSLLSISYVVSLITLYTMNALVVLFTLLCLFIYGMLSLSQSRLDKTKRRQEGVE